MRKKMQLLQAVICISLAVPAKTNAADTTRTAIEHVTDGNISEWKPVAFETDKGTEISYAVDHDENSLHLALRIGSPRTQMRIMRMGMSLFIDKKGKHREGSGIQFPIRSGSSSIDRSEMTQPDGQAMRDEMAATMILLRLFGFDDEDKTQLIATPNSVNVAYGWDDANVLYIEYQVPLKMLGKKEDLTGKPVAIGWKINGAEENAAAPVAVSSRMVSAPVGRGAPPSRTGIGNLPPAGGMAKGIKEQYFWTKYNMTF